MIDKNAVHEALRAVLHPKLKKPLMDLGMIRNVEVHDNSVYLTLALKCAFGPLRERLVRQLEEIVGSVSQVDSVKIAVTTLSQEEIPQLFPSLPLKGIEKVVHFVAVASGKGGVGKTSIAINLALALVRENHKVGLLDADVYGPSVPLMLAIPDALDQVDGMIVPHEKFGLQIVSMGMTAGRNEAFIWRGPLVAKMIRRLLGQVHWGDLDFLVIDLPPGTGDPSITVAQALPHASILMVTTPQEVALADVRRAVTLFKKNNLRILGLVENMSCLVCRQSPLPIDIFGHGGGKRLCQELDIPFLDSIPFDLELRRGSDAGKPLMVFFPGSETGIHFQELAGKISQACCGFEVDRVECGAKEKISVLE